MHWTGKVESVAFTLFGREVAWYGIIITSAMLIGLLTAIRLARRVKIKSDDLLEMFLIAIPMQYYLPDWAMS
ncbi:MAG: prolipoprotein diacylglyceryl transferase [Clostridia bacterium]|nr:prolipoprotein diacylglyceryl transferase [Clostridia bacterium]